MRRITTIAVILGILLSLVLVASVYAAPAQADRGAWAPNTAYVVNDTVTYGGCTYRVLQSHTSLAGWEPPNVPALFTQVSCGTSPTNTPTRTPTRTNTPAGSTNTPSRTPTRTNTPVGPTNTPTRTNTPTGPTNTPAPTTNLALNRPATSSSNENTSLTPNLAFDGNTGTRWASQYSDPQWLQVDLGSTQSISRVRLNWEAAYGRSYQIQVSNDGASWTSIYSTTTGDGAIDDLTVSSSGRYVRMYGTARGTSWGYSLWEFEVYGPGGTVNTPTPTRTPTRTNTPVGPTNTPTRTPCPPGANCGTALPPTNLPKHVMVGYWHNFDNGSGYIQLRNVSTKWDVINVSFAEPTNGASGGTIGFTPYNTTVAQFQADIAYLHSLGKKVIISIGGANGTVQLTTTGARDNFVNSMKSIINTYGFDGMDIDFEGQSLILNAGDSDPTAPTTPVIVNTISAIRSIRSSYGSNFILTMAPETFFVQLGYSFYGGTCSGCDRRAGAFLPVIYGTRDILTWLQVQDYNSGPITGLDNQYHTMGGADFHIAMLDMLLAGFPVALTGKTFPALRADQVVLGVPATVNAGNGYVAPATVQSALNYIIRGTPTGSYVKRSANAPDFRGVMTWSINWDAYMGIYEFSNSYRTYLNGLP